MQIKRLKISNVRVFEDIEFNFQAGMNLLVGINGAGKSTVLDVIRIMLSKQMHLYTAARGNRIGFEDTYITAGQDQLAVELDFELGNVFFKHTLEWHKGTPNSDGELAPRYTAAIRKEVERDERNPIAIYFSTSRSLPDAKKPTSSVNKNAQSSAYVDALKSRQLRLKEFAQWWLALEKLKHENPANIRLLEVLNTAVQTFLERYGQLRANSENQTLYIEKGKSVLDIRQLSDGERSMLAVALDVAKRLALANPTLANPLEEGTGVILIDEIGIHLHPAWERKVVERLTNTFPKCQFIATTHSPQIIGEVAAEQIILIDHGREHHPNQSLGMDTNWILRHVMGVSERETDTKQELDRIEELIDNEDYDAATDAIEQLRVKLGEFPKLVDLQARIDAIMFWEDEED